MSVQHDILLVEDEVELAELLRRVLVRAGYRVRVVTDGIQALWALGEERPAVLILDLMLPGVSGFAILEYLHQQEISTPIIIVTANPFYQDSLQHAGIRQVLIKPFQLEQLLDALGTILGFSTTV